MHRPEERIDTSSMSRRHQPLPHRLVGAGIAAAAVAGTLVAGCGSTPASDGPLVLTMPVAGGAVASCLPLTTGYLAEMSPAFAGTVTDVGDDTVTMHVDHWYAGSGPEEVSLAIPPGAHTALIGEIDFREGVTYLITAAEGTVNMCGYSGEATAELQAVFDAAF